MQILDLTWFAYKVFRMLKNILRCLALIFLLTGCDTKPDTCKEQSAWTMRVGFYKVDTVKGIRAIKDSVLRLVVVHTDSLRRVNVVNFELYQSVDTTLFSMTVNNMPSATLYAIYKRERIFENYKCGFRTNFFLDTLYTVPQICDSIIIVHPNITDVHQENCRFYFNNDSTKYL